MEDYLQIYIYSNEYYLTQIEKRQIIFLQIV